MRSFILYRKADSPRGPSVVWVTVSDLPLVWHPVRQKSSDLGFLFGG